MTNSIIYLFYLNHTQWYSKNTFPKRYNGLEKIKE